MGLDIALGVIVLLAGIRGWFKGFVRQVIPLGALVGCVFLADPLRDLVRPYAVDYFPKFNLEVLNKILWWSSAVVAYVVTSGIAFAIVKSFRKKTYGEPEPNRADQGAGFTLGVAKGLIAVSWLASGIGSWGPKVYNQAPFAEKQTKESRAMEFAEQYHPAETLWRSRPVQIVVERVKTRGIWGEGAKEPEKAVGREAKVETARPEAAADPLKTASERPKTLSLPSMLDTNSPEFLSDLEAAMRREGIEPR